MLGASFISTVIGTKLPGDGALWFSQSLEFILPVRIGDTITVVAQIINIHQAQQIVELNTTVYNQDKQKVITGTAKVKIVEEEIAKIENPINREKIALVIGSTGGIGSEISIQLARKGYDVYLHYHTNEEKALELKKTIEETGKKATIYRANLLLVEEINRLADLITRKCNHIPVIIFAATLHVPNISFKNLDWEDLQKHYDINIKPLFHLVKSLGPDFIKQNFGRIVAITSQYSESSPPKEMMHYVTGKSALNGFMKALAIELAPYHVTVNLVSPSMTDTELISNIPQKQKLLYAAQTPMKRLALAKDVAHAVLFLVSDESDYITGQTIRVNGGINML